MVRLTDRATLTKLPSSSDGIELPPLREPDSLETSSSFRSSAGATVMTSAELAEARSAATPPAPGSERFGDRVSHMTNRFVLSGSNDAYRIWRFQSAASPIEFPPTEAGWADAWARFRELDGQAT